MRPTIPLALAALASTAGAMRVDWPAPSGGGNDAELVAFSLDGR